MNSITEGVIIIDPSGKMVSVNPAARTLFDCLPTEEAEQGLSIWSELFEAAYLDGRPIEPSEWPISRAIRGESFTNCELVIRNRAPGGE